jgi:hypothetical protein
MLLPMIESKNSYLMITLRAKLNGDDQNRGLKNTRQQEKSDGCAEEGYKLNEIIAK